VLNKELKIQGEKMARMHSRKKGKHGSHRPPVKRLPRWAKADKKEVEELIVKLAKEHYNSAVIGQILRDQYGIPDVKLLLGKTITQVMKENNSYPSMPEDMLSLLKKAVLLRAHMEKHRQDYHSKKGLENLESKIRRLGKYYSRTGILPKGWRYSPEEAKLLVQKG